MNILLVEDDERIVEFLKRGLTAESYVVDVAKDGRKGYDMARASDYRMIILDLMLPRMHGKEVCQELRVAGVRAPILMLTAMDSLEDVVAGLRLGADDYMTKPFAFSELLARIEALTRRGGGVEVKPRELRVHDLVFDRDGLVVTRAGQAIELTSKELALLELLMTSVGKVISRTRILENVWGATIDPLTNIIDVYIRRLRAKIDDGYDVPLIKTIRGRGYKMQAPEGESNAAAS